HTRFSRDWSSDVCSSDLILRPKYSDDMDKFIAGIVADVRKAIETEDWDTFERHFETMIDQANAYHEQYDKGFLRWKMPDQPPPEIGRASCRERVANSGGG